MKRKYIGFLEELTQFIDKEIWLMDWEERCDDTISDAIARLQNKIDDYREELKND